MKYISHRTLGAKSKVFKWAIVPEEGLTIYRQFSTGEQVDVFSLNEIEQIIHFAAKKGIVPLANNVEKLHRGTEKVGLGSFVYNNVDKDIYKAQAMSQFAAIMVHSGVFGYNGAMRNMEFWVKDEDWQASLQKKNRM